MLTVGDINKLKSIFVTKEELQLELKKQSAFIVKEIADVVMTLSEGIQQSLDELKDHNNVLENHEHRLDKLEDKAFSHN